ncbi:hypothetical protein A2307_00985 [Candidatus Peregrinibacteria bacterium RIFOXYB2_FULL_33_20]|nr:MAG: hypothetical protein A2307_00985 [Candidatus Peregrinibacteria bacterium RIFOXYB2_FULL_33_20]
MSLDNPDSNSKVTFDALKESVGRRASITEPTSHNELNPGTVLLGTIVKGPSYQPFRVKLDEDQNRGYDFAPKSQADMDEWNVTFLD